VATAAPGSGVFGFVTWSPDGKHLFWTGTEKVGTNTMSRVFADGKPADAAFGANQPTGSIWEMGADGKLLLLVAEGQVIKRYRITPAAGTNIDTLLATAQ
jgi:hypothetical protein